MKFAAKLLLVIFTLIVAIFFILEEMKKIWWNKAWDDGYSAGITGIVKEEDCPSYYEGSYKLRWQSGWSRPLLR